ncbi:MAG: hypothetical protein FWD26_02275 [Treponema sp.]|nr:hypothetical protein [Treponema sp.]
MKKLFFLLAVLMLVTGFIFAQEEEVVEVEVVEVEPEKKRKIEWFNLEISVGFPVHWTNGLHNDEFFLFNPPDPIFMEDKLVTANTSIGIALVMNFGRKMGISLDADFFFGAKLAGFSSPTSDYNSLVGANVFFGPVFYLFNNNVLRVPLTIAGHMYYFADDLWIPELNTPTGAWANRSELQFGASIGFAVQFHFSNNIYIFSRTNVSVDFIRIHSIKWYDGTDYRDMTCIDLFTEVHWGVKPSIGLGLKF